MLLGGLADGLGSGFCPDLSGTRRIARFEDDAGGEGFARIGAGRWFPYGCDPAIGYSVDSDGRWAAGRAEQDEEYLYPCGISLASTWNPDLAREMGRGLALDARARGIGIMLHLGVNIYRSALCGRNFEYYGEDPVLASAIACGYIEGMQQNGVIATIKHFAANNQEYRRHATNSVVDERTLRELYFPVFKDAVQKPVWEP